MTKEELNTIKESGYLYGDLNSILFEFCAHSTSFLVFLKILTRTASIDLKEIDANIHYNLLGNYKEQLSIFV